MNFNYTLKYRTFDDLMADVQMDLASHDLQGQIDPSQLIKVALRVNYDLGLRIQQPKDAILEIEHGKAKLPDDFTIMNYALICGDHEESIIPPQGTHTESLSPVDPLSKSVPMYQAMGQPTVCGCSNNQKVCLEWNKDQPVVIQKINTIELNTHWRYYRKFFQVKFTNSKFINCECPNLGYMACDQAYIKDNFVWTTFDCANLYINYEGAMEDSDGNLLVPDHPLLNEYYEYALKQRILENLFMAGESIGPQIQMIEQRLRAARNNALSLVNTPNFSEMQKLWVANRLAMYSKYYNMFKSYAGQMRPDVNNAV